MAIELYDIKNYLKNEIDGAEQEQPQKLNAIDGLSLALKELPPTNFIIEGLFSTGLHLFVGSPKLGKSWLILWLLNKVANGENVWNFKTNKCSCLYLALEDSEKRLQNRQNKVLRGQIASENVYYSTTSKSLENGLIEQLKEFIDEHPDTKMVVVDTLAKIRGGAGSKNQYAQEYESSSKLKSFADKNNLALVVVHHTRKMADDDPFMTISGTTGLSGCADSMIVLKRKNDTDKENKEVVLSAVGRDIEQQELLLKFNADTCIWEMISDNAHEYTREQQFKENPIVKLLKKLMEINPIWEGSPSSLHATLSGLIDTPNMELKQPNTLSVELGKLEYRLKQEGIYITKKKSGIRTIRISYIEPSKLSEPSKHSNTNGFE